MKLTRIILLTIVGLAGAVQCCPGDCPGDIVVSSGTAPFLTQQGAVRWRSFGNTGSDEMYLGVPDVGQAGNRVQQQHTWINPGSTTVIFAFDSVSSQLSASIGARPALTYSIVDPGNMNVMQIGVADRTVGAPVRFNNVFLNGTPLGDFGGTGAWSFWTVSKFNFSQDWKLTGNIVLNGKFTGSQELSKLDVVVGVAPVPEPMFGWLAFAGAGYVVVRRRRADRQGAFCGRAFANL